MRTVGSGSVGRMMIGVAVGRGLLVGTRVGGIGVGSTCVGGALVGAATVGIEVSPATIVAIGVSEAEVDSALAVMLAVMVAVQETDGLGVFVFVWVGVGVGDAVAVGEVAPSCELTLTLNDELSLPPVIMWAPQTIPPASNNRAKASMGTRSQALRLARLFSKTWSDLSRICVRANSEGRVGAGAEDTGMIAVMGASVAVNSSSLSNSESTS
jgi:hypothetical protein